MCWEANMLSSYHHTAQKHKTFQNDTLNDFMSLNEFHFNKYFQKKCRYDEIYKIKYSSIQVWTSQIGHKHITNNVKSRDPIGSKNHRIVCEAVIKNII